MPRIKTTQLLTAAPSNPNAAKAQAPLAEAPLGKGALKDMEMEIGKEGHELKGDLILRGDGSPDVNGMYLAMGERLKSGEEKALNAFVGACKAFVISIARRRHYLNRKV